MSKTKNLVLLEYKKTKGQADYLERIADKVDGQRRKIAEQKNQLSRYWTGINANTYRTKMDDRESELKSIASELRKIASTIRTVAQNIYQADMRAVELAKKNGKGGGGFR